MMRKINIILICILAILLTGCGESSTQVEEQNTIASEENIVIGESTVLEENNSSNKTIVRIQKEELNWTTIMLDQSPSEGDISEEESMSEEEII